MDKHIVSADFSTEEDRTGYYLQEFKEPTTAFVLAQTYYGLTEAYDEQVCTGPQGRDGILPGSSEELSAINKNALAVRESIKDAASRMGIPWSEVEREMKAAQRMKGT